MVWIALFSPLLGALLNALILPKHSKKLSHFVASTAVLLAFLASIACFMTALELKPGTSLHYHGFTWLSVADLNISYGLELDRLSAFMLLIVTGIGSLIHIYAGGYMAEEKTTYRFFSYLNLFIFMMLNLVLGSNLLVMFLGWEGVGLCSYLLIGYWYEKKENCLAGMKAFVVNRIGDFGFLIALFLCYQYFGTFSFTELKTWIYSRSSLNPEILQVIQWMTLCFFIGACGKSAQIPLFIWLPDAMAGPTPVSALIHAATMVTAGVYMMARMHFFFYLAPLTMDIIAITGALTALMAASIALVQNDIKKVLAYSTVSQLGYMVLACGVGAFEAGVFHLMTHACFKALLFLGAGSVIVAMHHEQDLRKMGGLKESMPVTYKVFLIAVLAIIGVPGLSGFFSKDEILWKALNHPNLGPGLWLLGVIAAAMTAFYMVRLLCLTFYGKHRCDEKTRSHLHETPAVMWFPLCLLAFLSIFAGYLGVPALIGENFAIPNFLEHYFEKQMLIPQAAKSWQHLDLHHSHSFEWMIMGISVFFAMLSAFISFKLYLHGPTSQHETMRQRFAKTHRLLLGKYWIDELYEKIFCQPLADIATFLSTVIDVKIINGFINAIGQTCFGLSGLCSFQMTGNFQRYAMFITLGLLLVLFSTL